jgi:hypothetical protein
MARLSATPKRQRPGATRVHALCLGALLSCLVDTGAHAQEASGTQPEEAPEQQAEAAVDAAGSAAPASASDAQKQALVLLDQALAQAERAAWREAAHTLEQARKLAEFPNIVFHLARAYLRLHDTRRGLTELARFEELAGPFNPNRAEAERLRSAYGAPSRSASGPERRKLPLGPLLIVSGGGAALMTALITGLLADAYADELKRNCGGDNVCPSYLEAVRDHGQRLKLATNVLLGVGAAAVAVGTGWWLLGRRERARGQLACSGDGCRASAKLEF